MQSIVVPDEIEHLMANGGALAISISGGKDSQAMMNALVAEHRQRHWPGPILAIHAHPGRAEWRQTLGHCRNLCARLGIELVEVARRQGDLVQEVRDRMEKLRGTDTPPWPDAKNRYCTSDQKRGPIDIVMRSPWPTSTQRYCTADQKRDQIVKEHRRHMRIVAAMGMRAQESPARSKRPALSIAKRVTAKALVSLTISDAIMLAQENQRLALDWLPIHDWTEDDVWEACGHSTDDLRRRQQLYRDGRTEEALDGWLAHPAYVFGNQRLSCSICLAGETEVVTRDGLKPIVSLLDGNHELLVPKVTPMGSGGHGVFQNVEVRGFGVQRLWEVTLTRGRQQKVIHATAEHRWFVVDRKKAVWDPVQKKTISGTWDRTAEVTTTNLVPGQWLRSLKAHPLLKNGIVPFAVAQGFVYGDGTAGSQGRPGQLTIFPNGKDDAILPFFAAHEIRDVTANGGPAKLIYGLPRLWKRPPSFEESRAFLLSWLAGYFAADGCVTPDASVRLDSASRDSIQLARSIAAICGVGYGPIRNVTRTGKGKGPTPIYSVTLNAQDLPSRFFVLRTHRSRIEEATGKRELWERCWKVKSVVETDRDEKVFCAVVPISQAFGLSDDLMTGNCILASKNDILNGARHNPELYREYVEIERESGFTFRQGFALDGLLETSNEQRNLANG